MKNLKKVLFFKVLQQLDPSCLKTQLSYPFTKILTDSFAKQINLLLKWIVTAIPSLFKTWHLKIHDIGPDNLSDFIEFDFFR